jgi:uncharacterized membrane protein
VSRRVLLFWTLFLFRCFKKWKIALINVAQIEQRRDSKPENIGKNIVKILNYKKNTTEKQESFQKAEFKKARKYLNTISGNPLGYNQAYIRLVSGNPWSILL